MNKYIKLTDALDAVNCGNLHRGVVDELQEIIKEIPPADVVPVVHGRWIKNDGRSGWHCSCCGKDDLYAYPYTENNERELQDFYCPNCGAKMDEENEDDKS